MVKHQILVVDDEPVNFAVIEALLFQPEYELIYAPGGLEAFEQIESTPPDVILLDIMMPRMNGIEVCQRLKAHLVWQYIPIIVVTALHTKQDLANCLEAGAEDFISKPINGLELRSRVKSMLRIKQQHDDLQTLLQLREDMTNMLVHDLRNPLASVMLASEILRLTDLQEKQQKKVDQILIAGQQLQSMIDSLLIMAKLQANKITPDRTPIDLQTLGRSAIADFEPIAAQKRIQMISHFPDAGCMVAIDANMIRRVLDNLLSNAIKFSPSGSQVTLKIEQLDNGKAKLQVLDEGSSVSEALQQTIFEKFEVGESIKGVPQTGLGLAFCKMAVEAHDGRIAVANNHPKGTVFTVEL